VIFYGWGSKIKNDLVIGYRICQGCNRFSVFFLSRRIFRITLFFIPVIWWTKEYYVKCGNCNRGYSIDKTEYQRLKGYYGRMTNLKMTTEIYEYMKSFAKNLEASDYNADYVYSSVAQRYPIGEYAKEYRQLIMDYLTYSVKEVPTF
jgi:hypothetical protein